MNQCIKPGKAKEKEKIPIERERERERPTSQTLHRQQFHGV